MNFYILILVLYTFLWVLIRAEFQKESQPYDKSQVYNELNRELRSYLCCANNMKCCKKRETLPVEIRAILTRCPDQSCTDSTIGQRLLCKSVWPARESSLKEFQGFDEDEPTAQSEIVGCRKKLLLTMKISSENFRQGHSEFIIVDRAYDPITKKKKRLLIPYVVKLNWRPVVQMYGMKYLHTVNSRVTEEVINKHRPNFKGCDTTSSKPTCGRIKYKGKVVPYSEGFCCSCDSAKNFERQPETVGEYIENVISYSNPAFLLDGIECPKYKNRTDKNNVQDQIIPGLQYKSMIPEILEKNQTKERNCRNMLNSSGIRNQRHKQYADLLNDDHLKQKNLKSVDRDIAYPDIPQRNVQNKPRRTKRQVLGSGAQRRGGQNCADRFTPKGLDPETYHESAHCLRFSDIWYTVYRLQPPILDHSIYLEVFEKHEDPQGNTFWRDILKGKKIRAGLTKRRYVDEDNTISVKYIARPHATEPGSFALDHKLALFLVPEVSPDSDSVKHPEISAGAKEYLIVHRSQVSLEGDQCNVAGVGFEAFFKQPNRCFQPKGTCLLNQPHDLWQHDHLAEQLNKTGCFFLKYFGKLPEDPIKKHRKTNEQFLSLLHTETYSSTIDFEIRADFNTVLRRLSSAVITEVYVDSTRPKQTRLTVKITNSGLVSSSFIAKLSDCPLEMPASFNNIESAPVLIPPQQQHIFYLTIKCVLPVDRFHCSIETLNSKRELVALRRIRIQKFDRCFCTWHCLCACFGSSEGLKCMPMSLHQYHAAGFHGALPVTTHIIHYTFIDEVFSFIMHVGLFLVLILFVMGLCKALIGIFFKPVIGSLGLDVMLDLPKPLKRYYEYSLRNRPVVYNVEGWPVHPDSGERVRCIGRCTEFCLNVIFFFAYPIDVFMLMVRRICWFPYGYQRPKRPRSKYVHWERPYIKYNLINRKKKGGTSSTSAATSTDDESSGKNNEDSVNVVKFDISENSATDE